MKKILILLMLPMLAFAQNSKSWKEIANDYYQEKNYDKAIEYYQKCLEANPRDQEDWYNLACCFALNNNKEAALFSLNKAVEFGWKSCQHMQNDTDLSILANEEEFANTVQNCEVKVEAEKINGYVERHALMNSIGTYGVLLPPNYDEHAVYPIVIWLHGNGSSEFYHAQYVKEFNLENVIIIFPRAPYVNKAVTEFSSKLGWTAYQTDDLSKSDALYMEQGKLYVDWIDKCYEDAKMHYNIDKSKCIIFGHSQGAAYSLAYAASYPEKVNTSISFAGGSTSKFPITPEYAIGLHLNQVQVELIHGMNDQMVPFLSIESLYESLTSSKVKVNLQKIEAGHSFGESLIARQTIIATILSHLK